MAVDYSRSAIVDIRKYLLSQITAANLFTSTVSVVPVEQTPETNDATTGPFIVSGGAGLKFNNLFIDLSTSYHQVLGISPAVTLSYAFERK